MKIPQEISVSKCPNCFGEIYTFEAYKEYFCPECKGIWKEGAFRKTRQSLEGFLAKQLKKKDGKKEVAR